jgi:hypothetical protein
MPTPVRMVIYAASFHLGRISGKATLPIAMSSSATVANFWAPRAMAVAEDAFSKRTDELID